MKTADLKDLTKEDLKERLTKKQSELSELMFDIRVGQETDYAKKVKLSREIARIKTLINQNKDN